MQGAVSGNHALVMACLSMGWSGGLAFLFYALLDVRVIGQYLVEGIPVAVVSGFEVDGL